MIQVVQLNSVDANATNSDVPSPFESETSFIFWSHGLGRKVLVWAGIILLGYLTIDKVFVFFFVAMQIRLRHFVAICIAFFSPLLESLFDLPVSDTAIAVVFALVLIGVWGYAYFCVKPSMTSEIKRFMMVGRGWSGIKQGRASSLRRSVPKQLKTKILAMIACSKQRRNEVVTIKPSWKHFGFFKFESDMGQYYLQMRRDYVRKAYREDLEEHARLEEQNRLKELKKQEEEEGKRREREEDDTPPALPPPLHPSSSSADLETIELGVLPSSSSSSSIPPSQDVVYGERTLSMNELAAIHSSPTPHHSSSVEDLKGTYTEGMALAGTGTGYQPGSNDGDATPSLSRSDTNTTDTPRVPVWHEPGYVNDNSTTFVPSSSGEGQSTVAVLGGTNTTTNTAPSKKAGNNRKKGKGKTKMVATPGGLRPKKTRTGQKKKTVGSKKETTNEDMMKMKKKKKTAIKTERGAGGGSQTNLLHSSSSMEDETIHIDGDSEPGAVRRSSSQQSVLSGHHDSNFMLSSSANFMDDNEKQLEHTGSVEDINKSQWELDEEDDCGGMLMDNEWTRNPHLTWVEIHLCYEFTYTEEEIQALSLPSRLLHQVRRNVSHWWGFVALTRVVLFVAIAVLFDDIFQLQCLMGLNILYMLLTIIVCPLRSPSLFSSLSMNTFLTIQLYLFIHMVQNKQDAWMMLIVVGILVIAMPVSLAFERYFEDELEAVEHVRTQDRLMKEEREQRLKDIQLLQSSQGLVFTPHIGRARTVHTHMATRSIENLQKGHGRVINSNPRLETFKSIDDFNKSRGGTRGRGSSLV